MATAGSRLIYTPQPHEQAYYEALFQAADTARGGAIGGAEAVSFFSTSKLPIERLKDIWTVADQPATNALDRQKFAVAIRLIQLAQNEQRGQGPNLAAPPGVVLRPAFFEGISGVSVPMPPPPTQTPAASMAAAPPPMTPQRPPMQPQMSQSMQSVGSFQSQQQPPPPPQQLQRSLAVQDPYTMTPQEQSRYEALFPQHSKPDGYCYGAEAVALFSKSGVPQEQLKAIWSMVDSPVDNRLDKLEFAMAMHLIVCVSKKNLPLPPSLPQALKQLKAQQGPQAFQGTPQPVQPQNQQPPPSPMANMSMNAASTGAPLTPQMQPPPLQANISSMTHSMGGGAPNSRMGSPQTIHRGIPPPPVSPSASLPGPPPIQPPGGMSISDAFEGLAMSSSGPVDEKSYLESAQPVRSNASFDIGASAMTVAGSSTMRVSSPPPSMEQSVAAQSRTVEQLKHSYKVESSSEELTKLKAILQKLQAENISLKASMGHLDEEEKDVQRELGAVVAEIGKLSSELTTLRAKVLASKSRLMEATSELKATLEKKTVIQDLIGETIETKKAIDVAYEGIERANAALQTPVAPPATSFDQDLFGFGTSSTPNPSLANASAQQETNPAPVMTVSSFASQDSHSHRVEQQPSYQSHQSEQAKYEPSQPHQQYTVPLNNFGQEPAENSYYGGGPPTHRKNQSTGSFGNIMGGDVGAIPPENAALSLYAVQETPGASTNTTMDEVDTLKKKLKEAEDVARDAEDSRRLIAAELEEVRRLADQAEQKARQFQADIDKQATKKKGLLGGRGKKKDPKEGEQLSADANQKKNKVMQVQGQLKDAEALVSDTKTEVERLRKEVEDAEVRVASAASMQQSQATPSYSYTAPQQSSDYGAVPALDSAPSWFQKNEMTAGTNGEVNYNSNVMGGGGYSIPEPSSGSADPYSNPFE